VINRQRNVVLLLTMSEDYFTVDRVAEALLRRGAQPFRLDTDLFPMTVRLSARILPEGLFHVVEYGEKSITTEQVQAVWMRHIWQPNFGEELAEQFLDSCIKESVAALHGFLDSLSEVNWIDHYERVDRAENKLRQLRFARDVGLEIPRTLVTNDPHQAREFFQELQGKVVAKLLTPLSIGMEGSAFFVYTNVVKEEDVLDAEGLRYSPMVFQELIPKSRELRVIYVAGNFFVGALDATTYSAKTMDWRLVTSAESPWEVDEIPEGVARSLDALMQKFKLKFGAIDLIKTPDDRYVFLEVNPTGEWGMLERDLGYPISEAIADALLS